jgi:hypothetical protein
MLLLLTILLFAVGHMIRDGWPTLNSTQAARALGAFVCFLGAWATLPIMLAAVVGAAVLVGFYCDTDHAEGQGPWNGNWSNALYLSISGVTSMAPLAVALTLWHMDAWYLVLLCLGFLKPPIWFFWWTFNPNNYWSFLQPTRLAAMTFGASVGAAAAMSTAIIGLVSGIF